MIARLRAPRFEQRVPDVAEAGSSFLLACDAGRYRV
jgi:hypothetical protein